MEKREYVLTRKVFTGKWMQPGEVIELTEDQAASAFYRNRVVSADAALEVEEVQEEEEEQTGDDADAATQQQTGRGRGRNRGR